MIAFEKLSFLLKKTYWSIVEITLKRFRNWWIANKTLFLRSKIVKKSFLKLKIVINNDFNYENLSNVQVLYSYLLHKLI